MNWNDVGDWLKKNAGSGAALIGSLLTGNIQGAVAAGVAIVSSATGTDDPSKALEAFQNNPATLLRLRELAVQEADSIREHIRRITEAQLLDDQAAHREQQETIRGGDKATDQYVRRTRPTMARQSWYVTAGYVILFEFLKAVGLIETGAALELAMLLVAPAGAYIGFRTLDKKSKPL